MGLQLTLFKLFGFKKQAAAPKPQGKRRRRRQPPPSDPELQLIWLELRRRWFPARADLDDYRITWSTRRQKRTLASCSTDTRHVRVARELNYPQHKIWLAPLIYHEMCHAYLGDTVDRWHGPEFRALERRHPLIRDFNRWVKSGGWATAVRSDRSKRAHQERKKTASNG